MTAPAYELRFTDCPECGGSGMRMGCTREIECFDCNGEGEFEAACADCFTVQPLNDDGVCEDCIALVETETRNLGDGRFGVAT